MSLDWEALTGAVIRWAHLSGGIIWVGTLYYLIFVQGPALKGLEPQHRRAALLALMPRALWWLRWSAMITLVLGLAVFTWEYHRVGAGFGVNANLTFDDRITDRALFIMLGIGVAIILWFVVWFLIWPSWSRILLSLSAGEPPAPAVLQRVGRLGLFNAYLSAPMLLLMVAPQNYVTDFTFPAVLLLFVVGTAVMWGLLKLASSLRFDD